MSSNLPLAEAFLHAVPGPLKGAFGEHAILNDALARRIDQARTAWPTFEIDAVSFVEHLAQHLQNEGELQSLHIADCYLAFACLLGDPLALEAFDRTVLSRVPSVLQGNLPDGLMRDDVLQTLRLKLFVRQGETAPAIGSYAGRGALIHWLRASAVRVTQDYARRQKLELATPDEALVDTPAVGEDVNVAYLKSRYAPEFKAAFQEALGQLSQRDQNLLRLHYLDGISPEEIGRLYQTHRTTIWRWLTQCREQLLVATRTLLAARLKMSETDFSSLMNAVQSQLEVSLTRMLRKPNE